MAMTLSGTDGLTFPDTSTQAKSAANGQTGSAPFYSARAWVNFNGTGTVAIRASGNVSSITDNGVGDYTVNLSTAMPDGNYSIVGANNNNGVDNVNMVFSLGYVPTTTAFRVRCAYGVNNALYDQYAVCAAIFR